MVQTKMAAEGAGHWEQVAAWRWTELGPEEEALERELLLLGLPLYHQKGCSVHVLRWGEEHETQGCVQR